MWDMHGLVNHDVIDLASQGVIIGKHTTNGGISFSAKGGVIPFDNNKSRKVKASRPKTHVTAWESSSRVVSPVELILELRSAI